MQTLPRPGLSVPLDSENEGRPPPGYFGRLRSSARSDPARVAGAIVTFLIVAGVTVFVFVQLQPQLLFGPNMDVGGDTAGHVVAVHYLIHDLLPHFQITGWDPQWFGGFPLYVFYFPLPALIVAALNLVFPYAIAFKLVTALGTVLMPVAAYTFGRLAGYRRPIPALMSAAMLAFLFNFASAANSNVYVSWNIDGGTIASTMAGEFSFTLAMTFALFFLGVFAYALRTGRLRWLAAALFLVTLLCHVVPALFAAGGAVVLTIVCGTRRSWRSVLIPVGVAGGLLSAFWLLPFGAYLHYSSSMGYGRVGSAYQNLIPQNGEQAVQWLALVGFLIAMLMRDRIAVSLATMAVCSGIGFLVLPSGLVYNGRWLPFWFLTTTLLAGYAVAEIGRIVARFAHASRWHPTMTGLVGGGAAVALIAGWLGVLPFYSTPASERNPVAGWVSWNYSGYQAKPGWQEFSNLVSMTEGVAKRYGCGTLDYEYSPNMTNDYGSTLVPMSFPLWTNGCIDTTEGLYYESSTTTPFHFLDQAELSIAPSNPVVGIPYQGLNVADGVRHLQLMGVKYFLANSPTVEHAADADPSLQKVGTAPASALVIDGLASGAAAPVGAAWDLYVIKDSPSITPLAYEPVVESGMSKQRFLSFSISWYQSEEYWPVPIARSGPASWPHKSAGTFVSPSQATPAPANKVSGIDMSGESISFDVSRIGAPVLVRVPYFPNWQAAGATGPYEVTPNLMVVVPTSHHVILHYGTTAIDWLGKGASVAGIAGLALLVRPVGPTGVGATASADDEPAARGPGEAQDEGGAFGDMETKPEDGEGEGGTADPDGDHRDDDGSPVEGERPA
ncbi:MAG: hypothetical protein JWO62_1795 [Acidimicrobiaceae bacterium]|nr:hypothetical protein [Acidimicrobiaceae bacterium]